MSFDAVRKAMAECGHHPILAELIVTLPPVGANFSVAHRSRWLSTIDAVLALLYGDHSQPAHAETAPVVPDTDIAAPVAPAPATPKPLAETKLKYTTWYLSGQQQAVMDVLVKMTPDADGWIATPMRAIQRDSGTPSSSIQSVLNALEMKKLIEIDRRKGDGVNRYRIVSQKFEVPGNEQ